MTIYYKSPFAAKADVMAPSNEWYNTFKNKTLHYYLHHSYPKILHHPYLHRPYLHHQAYSLNYLNHQWSRLLNNGCPNPFYFPGWPVRCFLQPGLIPDYLHRRRKEALNLSPGCRF